MRHRTSAAVGALVCWALAVLHVVAAAHIVFGLRIGRVVAVVSEGGGHGVHQGDVLAIPVLLSGVLCFIGAVACTASTLESPRPLPWRLG